MNLVVLFLALSGLAFLASRLLRYGKEDRDRIAKGCQPVRRYRQWDPIWGLDMVISQVRSLKQDRYFDWLSNLHAGMPKTFSIKYMGMRWIYSIEPDILKAVYASNKEDFGVEPIRRHTKGSMPFADKGVNTTDGEDWAYSRLLIKPFFERDVYTNTDRIEAHANRFLTLLPEDGETFDIQPLIQRWVSSLVLAQTKANLKHLVP
jgi:hypothetical protein